jgi:hypothetical protein
MEMSEQGVIMGGAAFLKKRPTFSMIMIKRIFECPLNSFFPREKARAGRLTGPGGRRYRIPCIYPDRSAA